MPRHNNSRHSRPANIISERFDTDYVELPEHPEILYLIVKPLKTVFRNICAAPEANKRRVIRKFDDRLYKLLRSKM